jgi:hypothetical protein
MHNSQQHIFKIHISEEYIFPPKFHNLLATSRYLFNPLAYSNARGACELNKSVFTHTRATRAVLLMPFVLYSSFLSVDGMTCRTSSYC